MTAPAVRARPLLFGPAMVRTLLAGTKTQTRRLVKPQPPPVEAVRRRSGSDFSIFTDHRTPGMFRVAGPVWAVREEMGIEPEWRCPYGQPGDRPWVRETLKRKDDGTWMYAADGASVQVPASDHARVLAMVSWAHHKEGDICVSIHMPRWASRLTLELTEVHVQRLHEISEQDAKAEGLSSATSLALPGRLLWRDYGLPERETSEWFLDPRTSFQTLWDSINGKRAPWESNPWVWAVAFKVLGA